MNGGDFHGRLLQQVSAVTQAADLLSQLDQFNKDVEARSATWERYCKGILYPEAW